MRVPPPLDAHAHLDKGIDGKAIRALGAFVFGVTRSVDEYLEVEGRRDARAIWGVGLHPGLVRANRSFDRGIFRDSLLTTPLVGEVGLDGKSRVTLEAQVTVLRAILGEVQRMPRIVSIHSSSAHLQLLRELHRTPVEGVVLHWWTGSPELTEEAVRLGCYFSLPPGMMSSTEVLRLIPLDRVLPETDHPYGDRFTRDARRPGGVDEVERKLGALHQLPSAKMRVQFWLNLRTLVDGLRVRHLFGPEWQAAFDHLDR